MFKKNKCRSVFTQKSNSYSVLVSDHIYLFLSEDIVCIGLIGKLYFCKEDKIIKLAMLYPSRVKETRGEELLYSPLALSYLARHTPDNYKITLYDEYVGEDMDPGTVDADLVAVSAITPGIVKAYEIGDRLRKRGIKTIIGSAHVTALPEEALEHYDHVCMGEGEGPWREFLKDFEAGKAKEKYFGPMDVSLENLGTPRRDMIHPNYQYPDRKSVV